VLCWAGRGVPTAEVEAFLHGYDDNVSFTAAFPKPEPANVVDITQKQNVALRQTSLLVFVATETLDGHGLNLAASILPNVASRTQHFLRFEPGVRK
jgi:hypothetical protein